jgi:hypothetical protein
MAEKDGKHDSAIVSILSTLLGYNRAGGILWTTIFVLAVPALTFWTVFLPRLRFSDADEHLFKAARHGDVAGIERALGEGATVNAQSPSDRKTALFRAITFGHADAVRTLLKHGANPESRSLDDKTPLQFAEEIRKEEKDADRARGLDAAIAALKEVQR